jgi:hypothetical protein
LVVSLQARKVFFLLVENAFEALKLLLDLLFVALVLE